MKIHAYNSTHFIIIYINERIFIEYTRKLAYVFPSRREGE